MGLHADAGAALRTAEDYFKQAVQVRTGEYKGLALKAEVQTLAFLRMLGENVAGEQIAKLAKEAALLLPDSREDAQRYVPPVHPRGRKGRPQGPPRAVRAIGQPGQPGERPDLRGRRRGQAMIPATAVALVAQRPASCSSRAPTPT